MTETIETNFDPNQVGAYAKHLAKVNESKQVVATKDILNDQGALLIKAGAAIDAKTTERIVKFKLLQPIEESVAIDGDIDAASLLKHITVIISKNEVALQINNQLELNATLKKLCHYYQTFPILRQKITVLSMQMKRVYTQSLFSAWVTVVIGHRLEMEKEDLQAVFIAALAHDIGMLHIDEEIINKKAGLTPEEWRQIYAHPIITEKILKNISGIPPSATRAVREHHERCDGTGYPAGKFEKDLERTGQIVAMADSTVAVLARMRKEGRNFRDILPVLQINSQAHFYGTYEAFILVLRNANLGDAGIIEPSEMPSFIDKVLFDNKHLSNWLRLAEETVLSLGFTHEDRNLHKIQTVMIDVATAVKGAGILDDGYLRFLDQVKQEELTFAYREIEDVSIMLGEIKFHLNRLDRLMRDYVEFQNKGNQEVVDALKGVLQQIEELRTSYNQNDPAQYSL